MKRALSLLAAAVMASVMTGCGKKIPRWEELAPHEEASADITATEDEDATGSEDVTFTDGEEIYVPEDEPEEAPEEEKPEEDEAPVSEEVVDTADIAEGLTEGFVGGFAFGYDEDSWEVLAQPGIGYFLTYKGAEDSCQIIVSSESTEDIDTIMDALTNEYEEGSFGKISDEELNGLSVKRVRGSAEGMDIELLLSQPESGGKVLVVQFLSDGQSEKAESEARKVLDSIQSR